MFNDRFIVDADEFIELSEQYPIIDVRTPLEHQKGHIPAAHNLPLFSNDERSLIGTLYKQQGRDPAILKGLEFAGPKLREIVAEVKSVAPGGTVLLHCWRGGMRSNSVGWLLNLAGFDVKVLKGGYKAFRQYVLEVFAIPRQVFVLSGATGTGKTEILHYLQKMGEQIIDLEGMAHHKGSSFGAIGELPQPTQQLFENRLALALRKFDPSQPVWLEDESKHIGVSLIPQPLWQQMRNAEVLFLDMPAFLRKQRLINDYGNFDLSDLKTATRRLEKRLGGLYTRRALEALDKGDLTGCTELLLEHYYDKAYRFGLSKRDSASVHRLQTTSSCANENAHKLLGFSKKLLIPISEL